MEKSSKLYESLVRLPATVIPPLGGVFASRELMSDDGAVASLQAAVINTAAKRGPRCFTISPVISWLPVRAPAAVHFGNQAISQEILRFCDPASRPECPYRWRVT